MIMATKDTVSLALVWSIINSQNHPLLSSLSINDVEPLVHRLFPGINFYSISGFNQLSIDCLVPVLKKRYPELINVSADEVKDVIIPIESIDTALASDGYEWQISPEWREEFKSLFLA